MKRLFLLLVVCIFAAISALGQTIPPNDATDHSPDIRERLITLALQNPDIEIADHQIKIAKYNLSATKGWWSENFNFSFNANEYSLKNMGKPTTSAGYYTLYPLYNMSISIPIGGIFSKPQAVKAAREKVAIAENERANQYRQIKAAVLTAYENYVSSKKLYTVESQLAESAYNDYLQSKEKFRNGQISVSDYNQATDRYQNSLKSRISAENSYKLTQINIEELIGSPINQVITNIDEVPSSQESNKSDKNN